ncbi:MAG TPA: chemotaxis protein CheW [Spirochaetota bacterium]|nr:chemotaxis protein CheW [Spirochaetota bacterium]HOM38630.1 chemotaxis protein CheW [Spirochaetota bacterium]HPQ49767.1 chemotaxis protein CheW [Spirochaetota bacterium]
MNIYDNNDYIDNEEDILRDIIGSTKDKDKFIIFKVENERYAINIKDVVELVRYDDEKITREVPNIPPYIIGIMTLRGLVFPVIDFKKKIGIPGGNYTKFNIIIVTEDSENNRFGVVVEDIENILPLRESTTKPPEVGNINVDFIKCISDFNNNMVSIIDIDKLLKA